MPATARLRLKPHYAEADLNLGKAMQDQEKLEDAAACSAGQRT